MPLLGRWMLAGLAVTTIVAAVAAHPARAESLECTDGADRALPFSVEVSGEKATGYWARPADDPKGIVVFSHGYGHDAGDWQEHLEWAARDLGLLAVAMDYRGLRVDKYGWPVRAGAEDGIAAAQRLVAACPVDVVVNFGVSMGGNTSGLMAAAGATRGNGDPLFDYWVDAEGVANVTELYLEARVVALSGNATATRAVRDIEAEMGGSIEKVPDRYAEASVVTRADDMRAGGLKGVALIHGTNDGLVGTNQTQEMRAALQAVGIPTQQFEVVLRGNSEHDTTVTGYATSTETCTAGHATETNTNHPVMAIAFERLAAIFAGHPPTTPSQDIFSPLPSGVTPDGLEC